MLTGSLNQHLLWPHISQPVLRHAALTRRGITQAANRMLFNQAEDEFLDGDEVVGMGTLGKEGSGRLRMQACHVVPILVLQACTWAFAELCLLSHSHQGRHVQQPANLKLPDVPVFWQGKTWQPVQEALLTRVFL